uniref:Putative subunit of Mediator complex n=1 Tax=Lotus japonicus TaxID=34305 RepID=A0A3G9DI33_LOTJA|nr:putative subunit of Mediator complex [Lotus japonicus]
MDSVVDSLNNAYQDLVDAAANVLEAKENVGALETTATDTAPENFKQKLILFKVACDQAEEFVRRLFIELQHSSGALSHPSAPFDVAFSEDASDCKD